MNNLLLNWLQETLNRLFIKQPKYFKYWTWLSMFGMAVSGIPYVLVQFNIILPEPFATFSNKFVSGMSIAMYWMSKLVVRTPQVGKTTEGQAIQVTSEKEMPFTAKSEAAEVAKEKPPLEVIPEVPEKAPEENKP